MNLDIYFSPLSSCSDLQHKRLALTACPSVNFARLGWLQFGHSTGLAMPTTMKPTA